MTHHALVPLAFRWTLVAILGASAMAQIFPPAGTVYLNAQNPYSIASADFNADGTLDLAVTCNQTVPGRVLLYFNNGNGTFGAPVPFTVARGATHLATGDLDGDGNPDVVTANRYLSGSVSILWGTGAGGAASLGGLQNLTTTSGADHVAIGDLNGDGHPDLATSNGGGGQVNVFLNNQGSATRSFLPVALWIVGPLHPPSDIGIGDVNGDGMADLVTANNNDSTISVLLGVGGGSFGTATRYPVPGPFYLTLGDLDHDGDLDVVTSHANADFLCVVLGNGDGTFGAATPYAVQALGSPRPAAIGDVDRDGHPDVVVCNYDTTTIEVFRGDGTGVISSYSLHATGFSPHGIVLRDFDGDGWLDAATANYIGSSLSVFLNLRPQPPFCPGGLVANGNFTAGLVPGGLNGGTGAVASWSGLTGSAMVLAASGCSATGCIQMHGNRTTGDSIKQALSGIQANHTYRITFCHRFVSDSTSVQTSVRFRLSTTNVATPSAYPSSSGSYTEICRTPAQSATSWTTYTYDWTPAISPSWLAINAENDLGGTVAANLSWGEIDDLCVREVPFYAAFVFDRSDEMVSPRDSNSITAATADIANWFAMHPNSKVQVHEFLGINVAQIGGAGTWYTSAAAATTALSSLSPLASGKPLAHGLCAAKDGLVALDATAEPWQRALFLYCCGGDDGSTASSCRGTAPEATAGNRCAQMPPDTQHPTAFTAGSWQQAVCDLLAAQIEIHAYYWDDFVDSVGQKDLVAALCNLTGGTMTRVWDGSTGPVVNPWRVSGIGCKDFHDTRLSMTHDGIPQIGETIRVGCRTSNPLPYVLGVGFQNTSIGSYQLPLDLTPFGAQGCQLYTSWDITAAFVLWHGEHSLAIPGNPALVGLTLYWQGLQPHVLNNQLGIATSNLLKVTIAP